MLGFFSRALPMGVGHGRGSMLIGTHIGFHRKNTEISIFATIHIKYITNSTVFYLNSTHGYLYLSPHPQRIKAFKLLLNCAQLCIKF